MVRHGRWGLDPESRSPGTPSRMPFWFPAHHKQTALLHYTPPCEVSAPLKPREIFTCLNGSGRHFVTVIRKVITSKGKGKT